jgi:hypothetical protein
MRFSGKASVLVVVMVFAISTFSAFAGVPQLISFEGTLRDANGNPVPDGSYDVTFAIYGSPTGGSALWTESWDGNTSRVATKNGMFNVQLGMHNPIPVDFFSDNSNTFLGIKVGLDDEMIPRQRISSVAYAFTAGTGGIPSGGIIMWSGAENTIPDGRALCDGTDGTPDLRNRFIVGAGGEYAPEASGGNKYNDLSHSHSASHSHTVSGSTSWNGEHRHCNTQAGGCGDGFSEGGSRPSSVDGNHNHSVSGTTSNINLETGIRVFAQVENRPPYYALCFIMKK